MLLRRSTATLLAGCAGLVFTAPGGAQVLPRPRSELKVLAPGAEATDRSLSP